MGPNRLQLTKHDLISIVSNQTFMKSQNDAYYRKINMYPPFFTPNNFADRSMIVSFDGEHNNFGNFRNFHGLLAEQLVYSGLEKTLPNITKMATVIHGFSMGEPSKISWTAIKQICQGSSSMDLFGCMEVDFVMLIPTSSELMIFTIEIKSKCNIRSLKSAWSQMKKHANTFFNLFHDKTFIQIIPISVLVNDQDHTQMNNDKEENNSKNRVDPQSLPENIFELNMDGLNEFFESDGNFWSFVKSKIFKNRTSPFIPEMKYVDYKCEVLFLLALDNFFKISDTAANQISQYSDVVQIGNEYYRFDEKKINKRSSCLNILNILHKQLYMKAFRAKLTLKNVPNSNFHCHLSCILLGNVRKYIRFFMDVITEEQSAVLNTPDLVCNKVAIFGPYGSGKTLLMLIKALAKLDETINENETNKCSGVIIVANRAVIHQIYKPLIGQHFNNLTNDQLQYWDQDSTGEASTRFAQTNFRKSLAGKWIFVDETLDFARKYVGLRKRLVLLASHLKTIGGLWCTISDQGTVADPVDKSSESDLLKSKTIKTLNTEGFQTYYLSRALRYTSRLNLFLNRAYYWHNHTFNNSYSNLLFGPKINIRVLNILQISGFEIIFDLIMNEVLMLMEYLKPSEIAIHLDYFDSEKLPVMFANYVAERHHIRCALGGPSQKYSAKQSLTIFYSDSQWYENSAGSEFKAIVVTDLSASLNDAQPRLTYSRATFAASFVIAADFSDNCECLQPAITGLHPSEVGRYHQRNRLEWLEWLERRDIVTTRGHIPDFKAVQPATTYCRTFNFNHVFRLTYNLLSLPALFQRTRIVQETILNSANRSSPCNLQWHVRLLTAITPESPVNQLAIVITTSGSNGSVEPIARIIEFQIKVKVAVAETGQVLRTRIRRYTSDQLITLGSLWRISNLLGGNRHRTIQIAVEGIAELPHKVQMKSVLAGALELNFQQPRYRFKASQDVTVFMHEFLQCNVFEIFELQQIDSKDDKYISYLIFLRISPNVEDVKKRYSVQLRITTQSKIFPFYVVNSIRIYDLGIKFYSGLKGSKVVSRNIPRYTSFNNNMYQHEVGWVCICDIEDIQALNKASALFVELDFENVGIVV